MISCFVLLQPRTLVGLYPSYNLFQRCQIHLAPQARRWLLGQSIDWIRSTHCSQHSGPALQAAACIVYIVPAPPCHVQCTWPGQTHALFQGLHCIQCIAQTQHHKRCTKYRGPEHAASTQGQSRTGAACNICFELIPCAACNTSNAGCSPHTRPAIWNVQSWSTIQIWIMCSKFDTFGLFHTPIACRNLSPRLL